MKQPHEPRPIRRRILEFLGRNSGAYFSPTELGEMLGVTPGRVRTVCREMWQANVLARTFGYGSQRNGYGYGVPSGSWRLRERLEYLGVPLEEPRRGDEAAAQSFRLSEDRREPPLLDTLTTWVWP